MDGKILKLSADEIDDSLFDNTRQYLVGNLQQPQKLSHISSDLIEVGLTRYPSASTEDAHSHTKAFEYQYMLAGFTVYLDLRTGEEFSFKKGDFYVIEPGVIYAQKASANTEILFFKIPPGNDKIIAPQTEDVKNWFSNPLKSKRKDYYHDSQAPTPNSLRPAAAVAIFNDEGQILLLNRRDNEKWTMPGGTMEFNESLADCARREVFEETGFAIEITELIGTYTDPNIVVAYSDGEVRREFTVVYYGKIISGEFNTDDESLIGQWFTLNEALLLPLAASQKLRIEDVSKFQTDKFVRLR